VVVNNELQADAVHGQRATERTGLAHQYGTALAQRAVHCFNDISLAAAFGARSVSDSRQRPAVGLPLVGKVPRAGLIARGQSLPEPTRRGHTTGTQHPRHDAPRMPLHGQPEPDFMLFTPHKRPHLIQFQHPWPRRQVTAAGLSMRFFLPIWRPSYALLPLGGQWRAGRPVPRATVRLERSERLAPVPRAENSLDGRNWYSDTWLARHYSHFCES
jgi:hypothetical protein